MAKREKQVEEIIDRWSKLMRRLSGIDEVVVTTCTECWFEDRNGHSPVCSKRERWSGE